MLLKMSFFHHRWIDGSGLLIGLEILQLNRVQLILTILTRPVPISPPAGIIGRLSKLTSYDGVSN